MKAPEFDRVVGKFRFEVRDSGDRHAWLRYNGRTVVRTRRSHCRGDLPMPHKIRKQLHLSEDQLREAISCTIDYDGYISILRAKGVITD